MPPTDLITGGQYVFKPLSEDGDAIPVFVFTAPDIERVRAAFRHMVVDLDVRFDTTGQLAYHLDVPARRLGAWAIPIEEADIDKVRRGAELLNTCATFIRGPGGETIDLKAYCTDVAHDWSGGYARAHRAFMAQDFATAGEALERLVAGEGGDVQAAHHLLGRCRRAAGDFEGAIRAYRRALDVAKSTVGDELLPCAAQILVDMGVAYKKLGQAGKAACCFSHAFHWEPNHPEGILSYVTLFGAWEDVLVYGAARVSAVGVLADEVAQVLAMTASTFQKDAGVIRARAQALARRIDLGSRPLAAAGAGTLQAFLRDLEAAGAEPARPALVLPDAGGPPAAEGAAGEGPSWVRPALIAGGVLVAVLVARAACSPAGDPAPGARPAPPAASAPPGAAPSHDDTARPVRWALRVGGAGKDFLDLVAVGKEGSIHLAGGSDGDVDLGGGPLPPAGKMDIVIAKLDAGGKHVWSRRLGGPGGEHAAAIAVGHSGNTVVAGQFEGALTVEGAVMKARGKSDVLVVALDPAGKVLWARQLGGEGGEWVSEVALAGDDIVVGGNFEGTADLGGEPLTSRGQFGHWIAKLDGSGRHVWSRSLDPGDALAPRPFAVTPDGGVVAVGLVQEEGAFHQGPLVLTQLDSAGKPVWSKRLAGDYQSGAAVAVDASGAIFLSAEGALQGSGVELGGERLGAGELSPTVLAKLDAAGKHLWSRVLTPADEVKDLAVDASGNLVLVGTQVSDTLDVGGGPLVRRGKKSGVFAAKIAPSGEHLWSAAFEGQQTTPSIAPDGRGGMIVAGSFDLPVVIGGRTIEPAGADDTVLFAITP